MLRFLFEDDLPMDDKARKFVGEDRAEYLAEIAARLEAVEDWNHGTIREAIDGIKSERELSSNQAYQPVRAAVTFSTVSPPLFESLELLGKERSLARIRRFAAAR
jgi:glutamyl-tRNA synthetase